MGFTFSLYFASVALLTVTVGIPFLNWRDRWYRDNGGSWDGTWRY